MDIDLRKKLYRSRTDSIFAGLVGGVANYFGIDSSILRLIWLLVVVFTGFVPGVLVYIVGIFIVPKEPIATSKEA